MDDEVGKHGICGNVRILVGKFVRKIKPCRTRSRKV